LANGRHGPTRWSAFLFLLAAVVLVASVVIPAAESARVLRLLRDEERSIEPLRLLIGKFSFGVTEESGELRRYVIAGDSLAIARYRAAALRDDQNVVAMRRFASNLNDEVADDVERIGGLLDRWRALLPNDAPRGLSPAAFAAIAGAREAIRDSVVVATTNLEARLIEWSARDRAAVSAHERRGVMINAVLVLVALAALLAVFQVLGRERRRAQRESALRLAAEALARSYSIPDVARRAADGAMELLRARSAIVAHLDPQSRAVNVAASARSSDADSQGTDNPDLDRIIREAIVGGMPVVVPATAAGAQHTRERAMIIPLGTEAAPVGAIIAVVAPNARFDRDDVAWAQIFAHLVSLSYEKVSLLEEARSGAARLQRLMESRGRLIRGFSHDVKNPLGAADGYAALLQDGIYGAITDEQRASIGRVRDAVHRALSLIDDLHELARAETGHLGIRLEATNMGALVSACAEEYRAAASAKHLEFIQRVDAALPPVETDPSRVRQVVGNLLSNAIKYTAAGSIVIRARSDDGAQSADVAHVFIDVEDTGPGIPVEKHELIFEEFARLADGKHSGAGLGLAISRHVAEALGCRLQLRSEVGKGSTFTLCIPVAARLAVAAPNEPMRRVDPTIHPAR
jgi:signal transduction histidine kinase